MRWLLALSYVALLGVLGALLWLTVSSGDDGSTVASAQTPTTSGEGSGSLPSTFEEWAAANGLDASPNSTNSTDSTDSTVTTDSTATAVTNPTTSTTPSTEANDPPLPPTSSPPEDPSFDGFEDALAYGEGTSLILDKFGLGGPRGVDGGGQPTDGADGSGCAPGPGRLPDGVWLVTVTDVFERQLGRGLGLEVDLLCRYSGDNAESRFPDVDFEDEYVTNDVALVRPVVLDVTATFHPGYCWIGYPDEAGTIGPALDAPAEFASMEAGTDRYDGWFLDGAATVWVLVREGRIVEVVDGFYVCAG